MTYHQVLNIGDGDLPVTIDYSIDEDCNVLFVESIKAGSFELLGYLASAQIESIEQRLAMIHDSVVREMDWLHAEDKAADRDAFNAAYNDHPLGV